MADYQVALAASDLLGEGPFWDTVRQRLLRVDMRSRLVHAWTPATGEQEQWEFDDPPSIAISTADGGLVVAAGAQLLLVQDGVRRVLRLPAGLSAEVVLNDGKCDPAGRLWVGSYSTTGAPLAALYRIDRDGTCDVIRTGLRSSNGLAWNAAGDRFYHVDTPTRLITVAGFDAAAGVVETPAPFVDLGDVDGVPDGLATDLDGGVWVALFGAGQVRRYRSDGTLDQIIELPVTHPTSLAFGGVELRTLYVTSSRHRLTPEQAAAQPDAGAVFAIAVDFAGTPVASFGYR